MAHIGPWDLDAGVLIIAEVGNNHEGDARLAAEMVRAAADSGADAVKFQTIDPERLVAPSQTARLAQLRRFALSEGTFRELAGLSRDLGMLFLTTPFAPSLVPLAAELCPAIKIASGDNDDPSMLEAAADCGLPILLSTGMADLVTVRGALDLITARWSSAGRPDPGVVVLHCVSAYPTPPDEANLFAMRELATLGRPVGYSDHTMGVECAVLAVALGACVVEKHFTLDPSRDSFRDHALSSGPAEFAQLVARVRDATVRLGDGRKRLMPSEAGSVVAARRSLHAARDLRSGSRLALDDVIGLRPSGGIPVRDRDRVVGRRLLEDVPGGAAVSPDIVEMDA